MITLYNTIISQLQQVSAIKWMDLNTNQLQEEKPPIAYPCALIDISNPQRKSIGDVSQECIYDFSIDIIVKAFGETNGATAEPTRSNALAYFELSKSVLQKLQGYKDQEFTNFDCVSQVPQATRQGLKVVRLQFRTSRYEHTSTP